MNISVGNALKSFKNLLFMNALTYCMKYKVYKSVGQTYNKFTVSVSLEWKEKRFQLEV